MKNEASKTRSLKIAFVVNAEHLQRLDTVLSEVSKPLEYTVGFSDGTSVRYNKVEDIIKLPNSDEHSVTSLIAGTQGERDQAAYVTLRKANPESPSVEYTLNGTQRNVVYLGSQLDDWIGAIRQWYSSAVAFSASELGAIIALIALVAPFAIWSYAIGYFFPEAVRTGKSHSWVQAVSIVLLYVAEFATFKLFPRGTFAIGRGAASHEFLKWLRRGVLAGLVVSIIAGVIANLMTRHL